MAINKDNDLSVIAKAAAAKSSSYKELSVRRKIQSSVKANKPLSKDEIDKLKTQLDLLPPAVRPSWEVLFDRLQDTKEAIELMNKLSHFVMTRKKTEEISNRKTVVISFGGEE